MAFCPAGTVKVTKAGGGRVPYARWTYVYNKKLLED